MKWCFKQNGFQNRRIHSLFRRNVPAKARQMASNTEFVAKKT